MRANSTNWGRAAEFDGYGRQIHAHEPREVPHDVSVHWKQGALENWEPELR